MSIPEREIWNRFLFSDDGMAHEWEYEFELGKGAFAPDAVAMSVPDFYLRLLKKRVDAIDRESSPVVIAEVKEVAGMAALGQLLTYRQLYRDEKSPTESADLWAICGRVDQDVLKTFAAYGVRVFVV